MSINVLSTLIWKCWNVDQGLLYFNLDLLKCRSRFLYFNLELLKCRSRSSLLRYGVFECRSGSSLLRFGLLECWSKVFSTLIWTASCKKSKFGARLLNYGSFFIPLFLEMCDFHLFILDLNLYQEKFNWQKILFLRNILIFLKFGSFEIDI